MIPKYDVVIIGGGVMGASVAYHLLTQEPQTSILVAEQDPTYARASSSLSVGNIRVQFSLKENILISLHALDVLERFEADMIVGEDRPNIAFHQDGNVFLVSRENHRAAKEAFGLQEQLGCALSWLAPQDLHQRFPLIDVRSCVGATYGVHDGRVDGYGMLMAYGKKARALGASWIGDRVVSVRTSGGSVTGIHLESEGFVKANAVVNCAGAWAAEVAATAGIKIPVTPVRRQVYTCSTPVQDVNFPLVVSPEGLYFRTESPGQILVGKSLNDDPITTDLKWDEQRFIDLLWPELARYVPAFEALRNLRGWAGLYAVNQLDGNAILGEWPTCRGFFLANGFSGHGLQQAPAVGRYLAESILGLDHALDLGVFSPARILEGKPISESHLV